MEHLLIDNNSGSSDIEHAFCDPELQTVQIPLTEADQREKETTGKDISYFPKCIRIKVRKEDPLNNHQNGPAKSIQNLLTGPTLLTIRVQ